MSYYNRMPEAPINPPEDTRKRVYRCAICREAILEGDEYYDIPGLGPCCETCIDDAHHYDAELDEPDYDSAREEEMLNEL